ncbi:MAG TPA: glycine cleavage T C-terminal barrel domain-containing protein [Gemmatimonadaceae bacterium]|jgi:folate-binding protein YgfZ|nr:glycine cleavage T C-terminal barrel domain-containing protein [Gemmatimonadaceae bacterium]
MTAAEFTSIEAEYAALRGAAGLVERSARARMLIGGAQAAATLTGLVTNDVGALHPGTGQYAAALTAKGKVIADVRIFARSDDLLVDTSEAAGPGFTAMIRKFVNPRLAKYSDVSALLRTIGVFGPRAHAVLASVLQDEGASAPAVAALRGLADYHHLAFSVAGAIVLIARVPDLGGEGFDCFVPVEIADLLRARLEAAHAVPVGHDAAEVARVEAGRPLWGVDMDENTLAQEANFDELDGISYTKGCYTGQETVARVHFRGHVNRHLRGVQSAAVIPSGAEMFDGAKPVGTMKSSVMSPRLGPIGLAMVRREVETGAEITARWDGGEAAARVRELPFG